MQCEVGTMCCVACEILAQRVTISFHVTERDYVQMSTISTIGTIG